jgi:hypothetical protein
MTRHDPYRRKGSASRSGIVNDLVVMWVGNAWAGLAVRAFGPAEQQVCSEVLVVVATA